MPTPKISSFRPRASSVVSSVSSSRRLHWSRFAVCSLRADALVEADAAADDEYGVDKKQFYDYASRRYVRCVTDSTIDAFGSSFRSYRHSFLVRAHNFSTAIFANGFKFTISCSL